MRPLLRGWAQDGRCIAMRPINRLPEPVPGAIGASSSLKTWHGQGIWCCRACRVDIERRSGLPPSFAHVKPFFRAIWANGMRSAICRCFSSASALTGSPRP